MGGSQGNGTGSMSYDFKAVRVLVADDSKHLQEIFRAILGSMRINDILAVRNPHDGLARLALSRPELVITDLSIGVHCGIDFVRHIRDGENGADRFVPIILVTGRTEPELVKRARDCGAHEILAKPVSAETIYQRIVSLIETPRHFIQSATFFGPDRRRQRKPFEGPEKRSSSGKQVVKQGAIQAGAAGLRKLGQSHGQ